MVEGVERADSLVVNPHKWLFTPVDCSVLFTRRPEALRDAFSLLPEYLRTNVEDVTNLMDYGPALGRRFRALKLWTVRAGDDNRIMMTTPVAFSPRMFHAVTPDGEIMAGWSGDYRLARVARPDGRDTVDA